MRFLGRSILLSMASPQQQSSSGTSDVPKAILGAIAGDVIGSFYEVSPTKSSTFQPLLDSRCHFTDDSVLTVATMAAILNPSKGNIDYSSAYRIYGRRYPNAGYGASFINWFSHDKAAGPYNSWGNGSAMRVSPIGWAFDSKETVLQHARMSAECTHNHPEGIKGAQATALAVYLARTGASKASIRNEIEDKFDYDLSSRTVDDIRPGYTFDVSCQGSVPESILCFLESSSVEEAVRLAVSLGGDSDTQACIAGSIAEAYYAPMEDELAARVRKFLPPDLLRVVDEFATTLRARNSVSW